MNRRMHPKLVGTSIRCPRYIWSTVRYVVYLCIPAPSQYWYSFHQFRYSRAHPHWVHVDIPSIKFLDALWCWKLACQWPDNASLGCFLAANVCECIIAYPCLDADICRPNMFHQRRKLSRSVRLSFPIGWRYPYGLMIWWLKTSLFQHLVWTKRVRFGHPASIVKSRIIYFFLSLSIYIYHYIFKFGDGHQLIHRDLCSRFFWIPLSEMPQVNFPGGLETLKLGSNFNQKMAAQWLAGAVLKESSTLNGCFPDFEPGINW